MLERFTSLCNLNSQSAIKPLSAQVNTIKLMHRVQFHSIYRLYLFYISSVVRIASIIVTYLDQRVRLNYTCKSHITYDVVY